MADSHPTDCEDPSRIVQSFISEMHAWETAASIAERATRETNRPDSHWADVKATVDSIFMTYCTPKSRPYGRNASFRQPPEYNPDTEKITNVDFSADGRRAFVDTFRDDPIEGGNRRYVLFRSGGKWLIDNVKLVDKGGTTAQLIL